MQAKASLALGTMLAAGLGLIGGIAPWPATAAESPWDRTGTQWAPPLEWELKNATYAGNPFDLSATATFVHQQSGRRHTTAMFYDGDDTWKFRFTGTQTGRWTFTTSSSDPDLDGREGTVTIGPNPNPRIKGFLTHRGNKYAIPRDETLDGYLFTVYMDRVNFDSYLESFGTDHARIEDKTERYLAEAMRNGCEIIFVHVNHNWLKFGTRAYTQHQRENPDPVSFRVLETIIATAHRSGGRVHLWMWGDESRKWTPVGLPGGINGKADRRLQRYIAARLGPLPGWTMGYGFDLHEWTTGEQLNRWAEYLHGQFGWQHLLAARGFPLAGPDNINSYDGFGRDVPLHSSRGGPKSLREVVSHLSSNQNTPHLYEERHTYRRPGFQLDMDGTRRLLWWEAMAGGMGGFIGFYPAGSSAFGGHPYPRPEQLRTHYTFWHTHRRFGLEMDRAAGLSSHGVAVLRSGDRTRYVLYGETSDTIPMDLSGMRGPQPAVAVDTRTAYAEIDLGTLQPAEQTIRLPRSSDWAVAVGSFPLTGRAALQSPTPAAAKPAH